MESLSRGPCLVQGLGIFPHRVFTKGGQKTTSKQVQKYLVRLTFNLLNMVKSHPIKKQTIDIYKKKKKEPKTSSPPLHLNPINLPRMLPNPLHSLRPITILLHNPLTPTKNHIPSHPSPSLKIVNRPLRTPL